MAVLKLDRTVLQCFPVITWSLSFQNVESLVFPPKTSFYRVLPANWSLINVYSNSWYSLGFFWSTCRDPIVNTGICWPHWNDFIISRARRKNGSNFKFIAKTTNSRYLCYAALTYILLQYAIIDMIDCINYQCIVTNSFRPLNHARLTTDEECCT